MTSTRFKLLALAIVGMLATVSVAQAEIQSVRLHIFGYFNNYQVWRMKRALRLWISPEDISFKDAGSFVTVVEIKPPKNKKMRFNRIINRLKDTRLLGSVTSGHLVWRKEAVAVGKLYRYQNWRRRRRYRERPALWVTDAEQIILLARSKKVDDLQLKVLDKTGRELPRAGRKPTFRKDYPDIIVKGNLHSTGKHRPVLVVKQFAFAEDGLPKEKPKKQRQGWEQWIPFL